VTRTWIRPDQNRSAHLLKNKRTSKWASPRCPMQSVGQAHCGAVEWGLRGLVGPYKLSGWPQKYQNRQQWHIPSKKNVPRRPSLPCRGSATIRSFTAPLLPSSREAMPYHDTTRAQVPQCSSPIKTQTKTKPPPGSSPAKRLGLEAGVKERSACSGEISSRACKLHEPRAGGLFGLEATRQVGEISNGSGLVWVE
jgi:hypothetical protein